MEVISDGGELGELPWLMLFGWYLAVLLQRDTTAASV